MICRSGARSANACAFLQDKGLNVTNVTGGMLAWKGEVI
ncbi:rhodanese-like domain-containing protein [Pediococcus pentosaceus]